MPLSGRKLILLALVGAVVAITIVFWENDAETLVVLLGVATLLGFFILSGWKQATQAERDRESIRAHRESQRRHAAELPREHHRDR